MIDKQLSVNSKYSIGSKLIFLNMLFITKLFKLFIDVKDMHICCSLLSLFLFWHQAFYKCVHFLVSDSLHDLDTSLKTSLWFQCGMPSVSLSFLRGRCV